LIYIIPSTGKKPSVVRILEIALCEKYNFPTRSFVRLNHGTAPVNDPYCPCQYDLSELCRSIGAHQVRTDDPSHKYGRRGITDNSFICENIEKVATAQSCGGPTSICALLPLVLVQFNVNWRDLVFTRYEGYKVLDPL